MAATAEQLTAEVTRLTKRLDLSEKHGATLADSLDKLRREAELSVNQAVGRIAELEARNPATRDREDRMDLVDIKTMSPGSSVGNCGII